MDKQLLNLFSNHYKAKYGKAIGKIALGMGKICPNRKYGGCVYCSPASFTPYYLKDGNSISQQLASGKKYLKTRKFRGYLSYFQQETCTAAPFQELKENFKTAMEGQDCVGLVISTRPDYLEEDLLQFLSDIAEEGGQNKEIIIEVGLQSSHDRTLKFLNRNHLFEDFVKASSLVKKFKNLMLGVHLIVGLPGEDLSDMRQTVKAVCRLGADTIKFHHLQVIRNTKLHDIYADKPFKVYSAKEYLEVLADLLAYVPPHIVLHRLWSSSDPEILIQPLWGGLGGHELKTMLKDIMLEKNIYQGIFA